MKFNAHLIGGSVAGLLSVGTAQITGYTTADREQLLAYLHHPLTVSGEVPVLVALFLVTVLMSLFPDLDSTSIAQKWFYRFVMLGLIFLFLTGRMELFAAIALASLLPLLFKHRGWTHSVFTPLGLIVFFAGVLELQRSTEAWFGGFSISKMIASIREAWMFAVACVLGHYTHLFLDWKLRG